MVHLDSLTLLVVVVFFGATLLRSALGFGEALIAVPLLAFVLPVKVAAPIAVLVSITVAAVVVAQDWRHVHLRSAVRLVLFTLIGIPLGLLLLRSVSEPMVKGVLGVLVAGFAVSALRSRGSVRADRRSPGMALRCERWRTRRRLRDERSAAGGVRRAAPLVA